MACSEFGAALRDGRLDCGVAFDNRCHLVVLGSLMPIMSARKKTKTSALRLSEPNVEAKEKLEPR